MHGDELILTEDEYLSSARLIIGVRASAGGAGCSGGGDCPVVSGGSAAGGACDRAAFSGGSGVVWLVLGVHYQPAPRPAGWRVRVGRE